MHVYNIVLIILSLLYMSMFLATSFSGKTKLSLSVSVSSRTTLCLGTNVWGNGLPQQHGCHYYHRAK